ncbi:MAG: hypothetical protein ACTSUY_01600 [Alphaproteobacteria bacterium]
MPDFQQISANLARWIVPGLVVPLMIAGSGCALQGDLGREAPSFAQQKIGGGKYGRLPGLKNTRWGVPLTVAETDLRTRAYALTYTYAHRSTFRHWNTAGRVLPKYTRATKQLSASAYVGELDTQLYASPEARINAIIDDIRADREQIDGFWAAAQAVYGDDQRRLASISHIRNEKLARNTTGRIEENRYYVEKTLSALEVRIHGYEQAFSQTMATMPHTGGAGADLELEGLRRRAARLQSDISRLDNRYAFAMPAPARCLRPSIAGNCTNSATESPLVSGW